MDLNIFRGASSRFGQSISRPRDVRRHPTAIAFARLTLRILFILELTVSNVLDIEMLKENAQMVEVTHKVERTIGIEALHLNDMKAQAHETEIE